MILLGGEYDEPRLLEDVGVKSTSSDMWECETPLCVASRSDSSLFVVWRCETSYCCIGFCLFKSCFIISSCYAILLILRYLFDSKDLDELKEGLLIKMGILCLVCRLVHLFYGYGLVCTDGRPSVILYFTQLSS